MHVGIITDGNRRWAELNKLSAKQGHQQGVDNLYSFLPHMLGKVDMVSVYLFSHRNWQRNKQEVVDMFEIFHDLVNKVKQPNVNLLINYKPTVQQFPDVDLVIRTGGHHSLSGFLPMESAFAELLVLDKLWPDFTIKDFDKALLWFSKQRRKMGK